MNVCVCDNMWLPRSAQYHDQIPFVENGYNLGSLTVSACLALTQNTLKGSMLVL